MKHFSSDNNHLLILKRGEELFDQLINYAKHNNLSSAWLSGLGGCEGLTIGYYDLEKKDYKWQEFDQRLEIISLTGNMTIVDNEPFWHIHGVFSDENYRSISGHVKMLRIGLTCEISITPLDYELTRIDDEDTGLKLIDSLK